MNVEARCVWLYAATLLATASASAADAPNQIAGDKRALAPLQAYVGEWRGVGQPKRGSNQGAWTEESAWAWQFDEGRASLTAQLDRDKYYKQLSLHPGDKPGQFVLIAQPLEGDGEAGKLPQRFTGAITDGALVVAADEPRPEVPARISLRLVAGGDRMLVLYEKQIGDGVYARLAEVGSTRKGSSFAKNVATGPECVVTGGLAKIAVEYKGKTYYVCCTGCRDLFRDDPEGVLEEYRQRKAAERAEKNEK